MVVVRVRGTVRAPVDLRATVESLTGYHHRTTAEPWFTDRGQNGTRPLVARELEETVEYYHWEGKNLSVPITSYSLTILDLVLSLHLTEKDHTLDFWKKIYTRTYKSTSEKGTK